MDELTHMATVEVLKDKHARVQVLEQQLAASQAELSLARRRYSASRVAGDQLAREHQELKAEQDRLREIIARLDAKARVANTDIAKVRSQLWSIQQTAKAALAPEEET